MTRAMPTVLVVWYVAAAIGAPRGSAQTRGTVEISPAVGIYFPTAGFQADMCTIAGLRPCPPIEGSAVALGGRVTGWISRRIAIDGTLAYSPSTTTDDFKAADMRIVLALIRSHPLVAYVAGGPAFIAHTHYAAVGPVAGGGVRFHVGELLTICAEAEQYFSWLGQTAIGHRMALSYAEQDLILSLGFSMGLPNSDW